MSETKIKKMYIYYTNNATACIKRSSEDNVSYEPECISHGNQCSSVIRVQLHIFNLFSNAIVRLS